MRNIEKENIYTSTGVKIWRHKGCLLSYKNNNNNNTVISTHISPESRCNLKCKYCSVSNRNIKNSIKFETIQDYVLKLKSRGLKAVILTGGGEPTLYKDFNDLVEWIKYEQKLSIALITNGTLFKNIKNKKAFSWVRISINIYKDWENKIEFDKSDFMDSCIIGGSFVVDNEISDEDMNSINNFSQKKEIDYVRFLPNCLTSIEEMRKTHENIDSMLDKIKNPLFFHQYKNPYCPDSDICHQSFFRPYLSEIDGGTVFPCDSLVLNNSFGFFEKKYEICKAEDILLFIDGKIKMNFNPRDCCHRCVFADTINMIDKWKSKGINYFKEYSKPIQHEEFI